MTTGSSHTGEISFGQELARKATHMGALVIPVGYHLLRLDWMQMLAIMVPVTLAMILIDVSRLRNWLFWRSFAAKIVGPMIRHHEMGGDFTGATYILLSVCLTIGLYDKPIAIAALAFIIVGDPFAAIIGRRFGRHRFRTKSVEGSLACLAGTVIVACLTPGLPLTTGLCGALVATITEALSFTIDDNISVPIVSGLAMTLMARFVQIV